MATIQQKNCGGNKYWYIVESRRVNGKPRPVVLAYLGKANDLLKRLHGLTGGLRLKSYSHGAVAALLNIAHKLNIAVIINKYIKSPRSYMSEKPVRNNLTAGITLLLGTIGRVCMPTSKRGWWNWSKTSTCEYLLRCSLSKVDSQHFWDLMDAVPEESIPEIETELLKKVFEIYNIKSDSLFFDTTNFFTYIDTTNSNCDIAQRGKNKQRRYDLRQIGLAMVVTRQDMIPLFHLTYKGNMHDSKVFKTVISKVKQRIIDLGLDIEKHTIVFDRGNNSKQNLDLVKELELYYVGALTPYHHKKLISAALDGFKDLNVNGQVIRVYRDKREVLGQERTVVVFISDRLKAGQIRGIYQSLQKTETRLKQLQAALCNPRTKKRNREKLENTIKSLINKQFLKNIIEWTLPELDEGKFQLKFSINQNNLDKIEKDLGFRILMTNHHDWSTADIIKIYYGQAMIELAFKNLKNPYHITMRPQFHWTEQKIRVHYLMCIIGYLLTSLVLREVKSKIQFTGSMDTLIDILNNIRLSTLMEESTTRGKVKATYKVEEMSNEEALIMKSLGIENLHNNRPKFNGIGIYT